ncbi:MAG: acyl-CoA dehydrogenase, partial [Rhodospirillales bacterium]|nr:acyl-CoA dehydrogenase [Rhodospirillales bacterium]
MDFALSEEQQMIVESARSFVEEELYPYEEEVEKTDHIRPELLKQITEKALAMGFYAANMPEDLGGAGLDSVTLCLLERELGRASFGLQYAIARPSNILQACTGDQIENYLLATIRGEKVDCLAMTEPDAGSDVRSMICRAERDGDHYVINGIKHFISHADVADFVILFAASGEEETPRGTKKLITSFLVDMGTPGFEVKPGYKSVSHRGYHNS